MMISLEQILKLEPRCIIQCTTCIPQYTQSTIQSLEPVKIPTSASLLVGISSILLCSQIHEQLFELTLSVQSKPSKFPQTYTHSLLSFDFYTELKQQAEKAMAAHSSCLENPMDGGAWQAAVHGVAKSGTGLSNFTSLSSYFITGKGNGNPLQYSCLENPMDRGVRRAVVHGVAESRHG